MNTKLSKVNIIIRFRYNFPNQNKAIINIYTPMSTSLNTQTTIKSRILSHLKQTPLPARKSYIPSSVNAQNPHSATKSDTKHKTEHLNKSTTQHKYRTKPKIRSSNNISSLPNVRPTLSLQQNQNILELFSARSTSTIFHHWPTSHATSLFIKMKSF